MCDAGFGGGVLFEEVADFEVEVWEVGGAGSRRCGKSAVRRSQSW